MPDDVRKQWLADFTIASLLKLPAASPSLTFDDPEGGFKAHLTNAPDDATDHALRLRVVLPAANKEDAEQDARGHAERFLHLLTFVTQAPFRVVKLRRLVDWTPGIAQREMVIFYVRPSHQIIGDLEDGFVKSAEALAAIAVSELTARAMRWFAAAVRAPIMSDQFQYFWFVIELLAPSSSAEKVTDKCSHCQTVMHCPTCNGPSTHRPYPAQRIRQFLKSLGVPESVVKGVESCRHRLMHGATHEELEAHCQTLPDAPTFQIVIDAMGEAAWRAITTTFDLAGEAIEGLHLAKPETYVSKTLTLRAFVGVGYPGDPQNPSMDDLNALNPQVSIIETDEAGNKTEIQLTN